MSTGVLFFFVRNSWELKILCCHSQQYTSHKGPNDSQQYRQAQGAENDNNNIISDGHPNFAYIVHFKHQ